MTHISTTRVAPRSVTSSSVRYANANSVSDRLRVAMSDPDLLLVVAFAAVGLLLSFAAITLFPDFGLSLAQFAQALS